MTVFLNFTVCYQQFISLVCTHPTLDAWLATSERAASSCKLQLAIAMAATAAAMAATFSERQQQQQPQQQHNGSTTATQ